MRVKISLLLLMLVSIGSYAQKRILKQAEINYKQGNYFKSLQLYTQALAENPDNHEARYKECICMYQLSRFEDAQSCFQYVSSHAPKHPISLNYFLAKTFRSENELDSALKYFDIYIGELKKKGHNSEALKTAVKEYEATQKAMVQIAADHDIEVVSLGSKINTQYPEYAPLISDDEKTLIFTACRPDTKGGVIEDNDGRYHEDIYISTYNDSLKEWSTAKAIDQINTVSNDAAVYLSPDGNKMIIYRHDPYNHLEQHSGNLFFTEYVDGNWSEPETIEGINSNHWECSATMSNDEKVIIFSSNRPGGFGGQDLYISRKNNLGQWGNPVNLAKINTKFDEDSPYLHADGKTLYFSSKGYEGLGGFDVFHTTYDLEKNTWSTPVHLHYPVNTTNDDLYFSWNHNRTTAYISSFRLGGAGDKDIYKVNFPLDESSVYVLNGFVKDSASFLGDVKITVIDLKSREEKLFQSDSNGLFKIIFSTIGKYQITMHKPGYAQMTQTLDLSNNEEFQKLNNKNILMIKE